MVTPTPTVLKDGQPHSIYVKIAGVNKNLLATPRSLSCYSTYVGYHDTADCSTICGWAWDNTRPSTPISVDLYADSEAQPFATLVAGEFRQDLLNAGIGNGYHAFCYPTPQRLKDGASHTITIKFAGSNLNILATPRSLSCALRK